METPSLTKKYNILDGDYDNIILEDLFSYFLFLEGPEESEDSYKEITSSMERCYDGSDRVVTTEFIDDSNKQTYHKLYFNGECDSNQTRYEQLSNQLHIATKSKNDTVGKCLHRFLRSIIDEYEEGRWLDMFTDREPTMDGNEQAILLTLSEMVKILESDLDSYGKIFDTRSGLYVETKLSGWKSKTLIKRFIIDVDIWDIYRIGEAMEVYSNTEKYKDIPRF